VTKFDPGKNRGADAVLIMIRVRRLWVLVASLHARAYQRYMRIEHGAVSLA